MKTFPVFNILFFLLSFPCVARKEKKKIDFLWYPSIFFKYHNLYSLILFICLKLHYQKQLPEFPRQNMYSCTIKTGY